MYLGIEIQGGKCCIIRFDEKTQTASVPTVKHEIDKNDDTITSIIEFQSNIKMFFQDERPKLICLCEAGAAADKKRIRMELCVLIAAEQCGVPYKTYPTNAATRYINTGFVKDFSKKFDVWFASTGLPKMYSKIAATLMRWSKVCKK